MGRTSFGACCDVSVTGVAGVESFATVVRLRFNDFEPVLLGVSFGGSGVATGAASSRARVRVDRRGSDMARLGWLQMVILLWCCGGSLGAERCRNASGHQCRRFGTRQCPIRLRAR